MTGEFIEILFSLYLSLLSFQASGQVRVFGAGHRVEQLEVTGSSPLLKRPKAFEGICLFWVGGQETIRRVGQVDPQSPRRG